MPANFKVNTDQVDTARKAIKSNADKYKSAHEAVFTQFKNIDNAWDGDDNNEFNTRVESFKNDFTAMDTFLEKLVGFLDKVSADYKQAESETLTKAKTLAK
ncbi:MAG: WXG100 family type VII secretion target [Clostridium sp.]|nr:WXG100 family type VII secretion target [Clostridium sp.]